MAPIIDLGIRARARAQALDGSVKRLEREKRMLVKGQETLAKGIEELELALAGSGGNDYRTYDKAVVAIDQKYNGEAQWGVTQTGTIVDLRAAFILGSGVQVLPAGKDRKEAAKELAFADDFFRFNELDAEMAQEMAKEAEIEGKIAITLSWEKKPYREWKGMVSVRYVSWLSKRYTITADPEDYLWYKKISWDETGTEGGPKAGPRILEEPAFVYKKFGGRLNKPNQAQPKLMKCLTQVDRLDRALADLREANHLYAHPTPYFKLQNANDVETLLEQLAKINWRLGKALASTAEFSLIGADAAGIANLIAEIENTIKVISGTTGIPIHFLGLLDLLRNRATGDNTRELVNTATQKERIIWTGAYEELLEKAMDMYNDQVGLKQKPDLALKPDKIKCEIPVITQEHYDRLASVWMPAALGKLISKEAFWAQLPELDVDTETKRAEAGEAEAAEQAKEELEAMKEAARQQDQAGGGGGSAAPGQPAAASPPPSGRFGAAK